jgi:hypothetical protein
MDVQKRVDVPDLLKMISRQRHVKRQGKWVLGNRLR